ncbi:fibronectin type III domain-containing protein [Muricauda oceani]|uniref:Fibronectin type-III domain-containing protein n=1 Tax=Flagellimonas oceani TaxID=2698672 RepID=A0A6G7IYE9_9FLAO|nr:fibronectin type III domain-containing protein [Allomuricauda oceani]MBW8244320.1 fibronectin type III domain-containing protein [Allomuricauda oceani]QII43267.1 hypothetical protein GVT53_00690 [Allomuricauda oceani]
MYISNTKLTNFSLLFVFTLIFSCSSGEDSESPLPEPPVSEVTCEGPITLSIDAIGSDYINLSWSTEGDYSEYDMEYGLTGFTIGQGTRIQAGTTSVELQNLAPNSEYDVYVRGVCSNSKGEWTIGSTFITLKDANIFEGNVTLRNQNEVEAFGAKGYTKINGSLIITGFVKPSEPYIVDLSSLKSLNEITGALSIEDTSLELLDGLDNIESVGQLWLSWNSELTSIEALGSLKKITGYSDMENVNYPAVLRVYLCSKLKNLESLHNIQEVDYLIIESNRELTSIYGLQGIINVAKDVTIKSNGKLKSLNGLNQLTSIGGNFYLSNKGLESLDGLENLETIGQKFSIEGNNELVSISAIENLNFVDELFLSTNLKLASIEGINLDIVQTKLTIGYSGKFTDLSGISAENTTASIAVVHCYNLTSLKGLESLIMANEIEIWDNPVLESLSGLNGLRTIQDRVYIDDNGVLANFCDLDGLINMGGFSGEWNVSNNLHNPTLEDMKNGICK